MLKKIDEGLWEVPGEIKTVGIHFPLRMVIVALPDEGLLLHSPVALDDPTARAIEELGTVRELVAPNLLHYAFLMAAKQRFAGARISAPPGLTDKRPEIVVDNVLGASADPAWQGVLDQALIGGCPKANELVFLHKPTRSLICTDLVFNMLEPKGLITKLAMRMVGAHKRLAQSKLWRSFTKDRGAAGSSIDASIGRWDFERVVMAHGTILEAGGGADVKAQMLAALWWMRGLPREPVAMADVA